MGIRAGAEMTTLEHRFIALRCKDTIAPTGTIAQGVGAKQVNARGEIYETKYGLTTPQRIFGTVEENRKGNGPCYLDTRHITAEQQGDLYHAYLNMAPAQTLKWIESGKGPKEQPVEVEGTEPYVVGGHTASGFWVDTKRETTVHGLFAAGDVAGGAPQKYVTGALAEGEIAAKALAGYLAAGRDKEARGDRREDAPAWTDYEAYLSREPGNLTAEQLERLMSWIDEKFSREYLLEYTVEAGRPDSITEEKLKVIKNNDITRISINPQSMQQKTLDVIVRKHTVEEIKEAYALAIKTGFDNINMDIIAGLPGEDISDMEDTLAQIAQMHPDSLTVHSLAIKRAARMEMEDLNRDAKETHEILSGMIERAAKAAKEMDLFPYYLYRQKNIAGNFENVGYAKVDKAGIYNILIMEEKQSIIAAGAGASTKIVLKDPIPMPGSKKKKMTRLIRQENVKAVDAYIDRIDEMIERKGEWLWH